MSEEYGRGPSPYDSGVKRTMHLSQVAMNERHGQLRDFTPRRFHHLTKDVGDLLAVQNAKALYSEKPEAVATHIAHTQMNRALDLYKSVNIKDRSAIADALIDSMYNAIGAMLLLDLPIEELWNKAHEKQLRRHLENKLGAITPGQPYEKEGV